MALPTTNITTAMVRNELGAATNNVGALCTHPNINKWAKYKPVRYQKNGGLTESERASVSYGLSLMPAGSLENLIQSYNSNSEGVIYAKPNGGNYPFRLGDFRGYTHNAQQPYGLSNSESVFTEGSGSTRASFNRIDLSFLPENNVQFSDILQLLSGDIHFGAAIVREGQSNPTLTGLSSVDVLSQQNTYVDFSLSSLNAEYTYNVIGFLAAAILGQPFMYYPLDNGIIGTLTGVRITFRSHLTVSYNANNKPDKWHLWIEYDGPDWKYLKGMRVLVRYVGNSPDDQLEIGEFSTSLGDADLQPYTDYEAEGIVAYNAATAAERGGVYVYFDCTSHPQLNVSYNIVNY